MQEFDPPQILKVEALEVGHMLRNRAGSLSVVRAVNHKYTKSFVKVICDGLATSMVRKGSLISVYGKETVTKPRFVRGVPVTFKTHRLSSS